MADKRNFDAIAETCLVLSALASTIEERDTFLDFARKWMKSADENKLLLATAGKREEPPAADRAEKAPEAASRRTGIEAELHR